jgi:glycosyltransferase involved in cell wall biosynthesis
VTGHSLASQVLFDDLTKYHQVTAVNLSKGSQTEEAKNTNRIAEVWHILREVWRQRRRHDLIYLTISESLGGNVKDLLIYLICRKSLSQMFVHLHGGSIGKLLFDRSKLILMLNRMFIRKLGGVIISGDSHTGIFDGLISPKKVHVVPNFAPEELFVAADHIADKFQDDRPLRLLYISGLEEKKGYNQLAQAYLDLDAPQAEQLQLDFVGRFYDDESKRQIFLQRVSAAPQMKYHGVVDNATKKEFFRRAHVFILPTTHFEGQPISILEAYASGCVVLATAPPGILDIFTGEENGFAIGDGSSSAIKNELVRVIQRRADLLALALHNRKIAGEKYRVATFTRRLRMIFETQPSAVALAEAATQST